LRTITVRADWLWLSADELAQLLPTGGPAPTEAPAIVVDSAAWIRLLDGADPAAQKRRAYNAALTCYNGQTVYTASGDQSLLVTDMKPVLPDGENAKASTTALFQPTMTVVQEGAALQITPLATRNARQVVLDVRSRVARLQKTDTPRRREAVDRRQQISPVEIVDAIDRPTLTTQRLATTLRMPVDRTVLIGGMTFRGEAEQGDRNLYLFAKASVQELRDDGPPPETPATAPAAEPATTDAHTSAAPNEPAPK
jgi:hypothetical protein